MSSELTPRSKTIDNLGIDPSIRYAQDQVYLDKRVVQDTYYISSQAQVDVTLPSFTSEFETLFQTSLYNKGWALFLSPPGFKEQRKRFFTFQILPSLGTEETMQVYMQRLCDKVDKKKKRQRNLSSAAFEEDILDQEAEEETKKLLGLFAIISFLDKILLEVNSRRNQYQKG